MAKAAYFSVYNYPLHGIETGPDLDALFALGTILIVREPTFKMNQNNTATLIRVDSPTDMQVVTPSDPLVASIRWTTGSPASNPDPNFDFKALGNSYFKQRKYLLAAKAYSDGIASTAWLDQELVLRLNRAQAQLMVGNFLHALHDTAAVLGLVEQHGDSAPSHTREKTLLRRARAFEGLRQFALACETYEKLLAASPSSVEAPEGIKRVKDILNQAQTGDYDWLKLVRAKSLNSRSDFSIKDFIGPIAIKETPTRGGGRGMFATRDLKPGELLLVEQAFAIGRVTSTRKRLVMAFNLYDKSIVDSERLELFERVVAKAMDNPSALTELYSLYGGPSFPASSTPSLAAEPELVETAAANLDIGRIEGIASKNCFGASGESKEARAEKGSSALFVKASIFNHACEANAFWETYNNVIVVRVRAPILSGEEIFLPYATPGSDTGMIESHLGKNGCKCSYCEFDRQEGPSAVKLRKKLVQDDFAAVKAKLASTAMPSPAHTRLVRRLERLISDTEKTYSPNRPERYRFDLSDMLHVLAESQDFLRSEAVLRRSVELSIRSHAVCDGHISNSQGGGGASGRVTVERVPVDLGGDSVFTLLACARRFAMRDEPENAIAWIKAAMQLEKMLSGGGFAVFRLKHDESVKLMGLDQLVDVLRP